MKKILLLAINWYIKSCKHLSLYSNNKLVSNPKQKKVKLK